MVEVKEIEEKENLDESGESEEEDESGEEEDLDEDVVFLDDMLEDNVGEFSIGDVILSTGNVEQGWSRADLEEALRQERIVKDWEDSKDFVGSEFFDEENKKRDFYGSRKSEDDFYKSGKDFYREGSRGGGTYETGDLYSGKKSSEVEYESGAKNLKRADEIVDGRRSESSVLESMGYGDGKKDGRRDFREYETRK